MAQATTQIGVYKAKADFSELIKRVEAGEHIVITSHGRPVVEMVPARVEGSDTRKKAVAALLAAMPKPSRKGGITAAQLKALMEEGRK